MNIREDENLDNEKVELDLRLLYQLPSSQLEFSKSRQWTVAYYTLLLLGGITGLFSLFNKFEGILIYAILFFLLMLIFPLATICMQIIKEHEHERSMCQNRSDYLEIRPRLSKVFQEFAEERPYYTHPLYDANFWVPPVASSWITAVLAYIYLAMKFGVSCRQEIIFIASNFFVSAVLSIIFFFIY